MPAEPEHDPGGTKSEATETIARVSTLAEAHVLRARLEEEGIPAIVANEHIVNSSSFLTIGTGGIRVQVPPDDVPRAAKVMEAIDAGTYALDDPDAKPVEPLPPLDEAFVAYTHDASYLKKWRGLMSNTDSLAGFNWWAAVFGFNWFLYRKMYVFGIAALLAEFIAGIVLGPFIVAMLIGPPRDLGNGIPPLYIFTGIMLFHIFVGFAANVLYYNKAAKAVQEASAAIPSRENLLKTLKSQGGINFGAAMLGMAAISCINYLSRI